MSIDIEKVMTPAQYRTRWIDFSRRSIDAVAGEREILLAALAEFDAEYGQYETMLFCLSCTKITSARRYYGENKDCVQMPHEATCAFAIRDAILERAGMITLSSAESSKR